jgi:hypothetical protein
MSLVVTNATTDNGNNATNSIDDSASEITGSMLII